MLDNIENGTDEVQFTGVQAPDLVVMRQMFQFFCRGCRIWSESDLCWRWNWQLKKIVEADDFCSVWWQRSNGRISLFRQSEGRKQKLEGKWNGDCSIWLWIGKWRIVQIAETKQEIIRLIYDKFIHTNMGISALLHGWTSMDIKKNDRIIHWTHLPHHL